MARHSRIRELFDTLYSLLCRFVRIANMTGAITTGSLRRAPAAMAEVRIVRFVFGNISSAESAGSASIQDARAPSTCRSARSRSR